MTSIYLGFGFAFSSTIVVLKLLDDKEDMDNIFREDGDDHFRLSLWKANEKVLKDAGIPTENIFTSNICTACNKELLYSHRVMGEKRGNMAAFMALR